MNLFDLPPVPSFGVSPPALKFLTLVERITGQECTYAALAGDVDAMDCALVATKPLDYSHHAVRASIARSTHKLDQASRLVRERYAWRGYLDGDTYTDANGSTVTLIAENGSITVGTMTIGLDGPRGLLAEEAYSEEISALRFQGRRVCELSRLALAAEADTRTVLSTLFGLAYGVAKALQDVTDVFIEVNPRHVGFYRRVFGFVVVAGERLCERVQAPAVLLRTSVDELEARLRTYCNTTTNERSCSTRLQLALA